MSLLDTALASKIKKSENSQEKLEKQAQAAKINNAALKLAGQSGDPKDLEMATAVVESIGNSDPDVSKIIFSNIESRIKSYQQSSKASSIIDQAGQAGGMQKLQEQYPMGVKVSDGGVSLDVSASKKSKQPDEAEAASQGTYRFLQQFGKSYDELKRFDPEVDKEGVGGYLSRASAKILTNLDALPETKALKIQIQPLANGMAREIEGGKVTDQDRKIYADSFASAIKHPIKTNTRLMSQSIINLIDKGGDNNGKITKQLKLLSKQNADIFNNVISQILVEYPDMATKIYGEGFEVVDEDKK